MKVSLLNDASCAQVYGPTCPPQSYSLVRMTNETVGWHYMYVCKKNGEL